MGEALARKQHQTLGVCCLPGTSHKMTTAFDATLHTVLRLPYVLTHLGTAKHLGGLHVICTAVLSLFALLQVCREIAQLKTKLAEKDAQLMGGFGSLASLYLGEMGPGVNPAMPGYQALLNPMDAASFPAPAAAAGVSVGYLSPLLMQGAAAGAMGVTGAGLAASVGYAGLSTTSNMVGGGGAVNSTMMPQQVPPYSAAPASTAVGAAATVQALHAGSRLPSAGTSSSSKGQAGVTAAAGQLLTRVGSPRLEPLKSPARGTHASSSSSRRDDGLAVRRAPPGPLSQDRGSSW